MPKVRAGTIATAIGITVATALAAYFVHSDRRGGFPDERPTPENGAAWYSGYAEGLRVAAEQLKQQQP